MKRQIVDILRDLNGGIVEKDGRTELCYTLRIANNLDTFRKDVTFIDTKIEDTWQEVRLPLYLNAATMDGINTARYAFKEATQSDKQWVFISILQGILVNNLVPKGQVVIWTENIGELVKICGFCETEKITK